jgi:hypothetical protein
VIFLDDHSYLPRYSEAGSAMRSYIAIPPLYVRCECVVEVPQFVREGPRQQDQFADFNRLRNPGGWQADEDCPVCNGSGAHPGEGQPVFTHDDWSVAFLKSLGLVRRPC